MFVSIVTDDSEAEPLKQSLLTGRMSPMSYSDALKETLPKEILTEDDMVARFPMKVSAVEIISGKTLFSK